jgi:hypothetical protein
MVLLFGRFKLELGFGNVVFYFLKTFSGGFYRRVKTRHFRRQSGQVPVDSPQAVMGSLKFFKDSQRIHVIKNSFLNAIVYNLQI